MPEESRDQVREHEFDGIREYDNRLPNWWLTILYGSIVFAVLYWLYFHTWQFGALPHEKYALEMSAAAEAELARMQGQDLSDETLLLMSRVQARVENGRGIFQQFCSVCHQPDGSGKVGPNLTDGYWLHGGKPMDILSTVTNGVPAKGMAAWGNQLGPRRVQDVVAFVLTIKGMNLPGKEPQGTPEEKEAAGGTTGRRPGAGAGAPARAM